jgi:hypothetical protein
LICSFVDENEGEMFCQRTERVFSGSGGVLEACRGTFFAAAFLSALEQQSSAKSRN